MAPDPSKLPACALKQTLCFSQLDPVEDSYEQSTSSSKILPWGFEEPARREKGVFKAMKEGVMLNVNLAISYCRRVLSYYSLAKGS